MLVSKVIRSPSLHFSVFWKCLFLSRSLRYSGVLAMSVLSPLNYYHLCYITQFRGGATQHGPKPRSHEIGLQKQVRRLGLKVALSARVAEGKVNKSTWKLGRGSLECRNPNHVVTRVLGHWELIHPHHVVHHRMYKAPFMLVRLGVQRSEPSHWQKGGS